MKNCKLSLMVRVPDWARWMTQDSDGKLRVFEFKPLPRCPDGSALWWDRKTTHRDRQFGDTLMTLYNFDLYDLDPPQHNTALPGWRESLQRIRR